MFQIGVNHSIITIVPVAADPLPCENRDALNILMQQVLVGSQILHRDSSNLVFTFTLIHF